MHRTRSGNRTVGVVVLLLGWAVTATAQRGPSLEPGARVRLSNVPDPAQNLTAGEWLVGTYMGEVGDTLLVRMRPGAPALGVRIADVSRFEKSDGKVDRNPRRGAQIGAGIGALVGLIVGMATPNEKDCDTNAFGSLCQTRSWHAVGGFLNGAVAGGLAGAGGGFAIRTERWVVVPVRSGARVSVGPQFKGQPRLVIRFGL